MTTREPLSKQTFEQLPSPECRAEDMAKFRCLHPEMFTEFRDHADTITQVHLNHPDEPYQLKLEAVTQPDSTTTHRAIIDGTSEFTTEPIHQHVETEITEEAYRFYADQAQYPQLRKQHYEISPGVVVDWYGDQDVVLKIDPAAKVPDSLEFSHDLYELVDTPLFDDGTRAEAHYNYLRKPPSSMRAPLAKLHPKTVAADIAQHQHNHLHTFITITGRSGSGKSAILDGIKEEISQFMTGATFAVLSTDDYHKGLTRLTQHNHTAESDELWEYGDWDSRVVYDVEKARAEIAELMKGKPISQRAYDFDAQEPMETGHIKPAKIIILEGLHAGDSVFADIAKFRYEVPTGLATSIGRRLVRDFTTRKVSGDNVNTPENVLRYALERAEPIYQAQQR